MSAVKAIANDFARALVALSLFVFLLSVPAALATAPPTVVQQASALLSGQSLCGHGQAPAACHAPNGCCRSGYAIIPQREIAPEPAYALITDVVYAPLRDSAGVTRTTTAFRSRAPPV